MGAYVYRLTARRVKLSDGTEANVAVYAYKPFHGLRADPANAKLELTSGCHAARRIREISGRVVLGTRTTTQSGKSVRVFADHDTPVYDNPRGMRTFLDDSNLGLPGRLPRVSGVTIA